MGNQVAIIGGTGIGNLLANLPGQPLRVRSHFGILRAKQLESGPIAVQRHSSGHSTPPHLVNYRAIAEGLRLLGVQHCLATAAVGNLNPDYPVGTCVPCSDFIDLTSRNLTLFESQVQHTAMAFPDSPAYHALCQAMNRKPQSVVYGSTNGPRYETGAEIRALQKLGIDLVGMTAASEAVTMQEAGIHYACLAIVTNMAQGLDNATPNHEEVVDVMKENGKRVLEILTTTATQLAST